MSLRNKSILVTGGAGFVGSHLVDRLVREEPEQLVVASNFFLGNLHNLEQAKKDFPKLKIVRCDVADYDDISDVVAEHRPDVVFNLSVIPLPTSLVKPEWTVRKNVDMTLNICRLQREGKFSKLIQFSSSEAPGSALHIPMKEDHPTNPETPYAASKAATDHIALSYHHTFGCDTTVLRPFNQYGPRQNAKKYAAIIPLVIGKMMCGEEVTIYGNGEQTRDFLYVTETADATVAASQCKAACGKTINIASGKEISIKEVVHLIAEEMDYHKPFIYKEARPGDVLRHLADVTLAKDLLGWKPSISFQEGIRRTVRWYVDHRRVFD